MERMGQSSWRRGTSVCRQSASATEGVPGLPRGGTRDAPVTWMTQMHLMAGGTEPAAPECKPGGGCLSATRAARPQSAQPRIPTLVMTPRYCVSEAEWTSPPGLAVGDAVADDPLAAIMIRGAETQVPRSLIMPKKKFRCSRCKRTFSMAAHLARHKNTKHGTRGKKAAKTTRKSKAKRKVGRPKGRLSVAGLRSSMRDYLADLTRRRAALDAEIAAIETALNALR